MINKDYIMKKMISVFPKWMDIRKRANKSKGGLLLKSIAEETFKVEDAIKEFKDSFFIETYFGKEEDIISFLYKAHIGDIELSKLQVINPNLIITTSTKEFYNSNDTCFYSNGYLYFKEKDIENNKLINKKDIKIKYAVDNYGLFAKAEKYHVWNVFDEFASFVGLKRHLWEDNKSLEKRILRVNEHIVNNTEEGLKNAIINELFVDEPDINSDDIKIEPPCPSNLLKYYNEFETIIDKLASINKDVYKEKQWDLDSWSHDIDSVDYIPHAWDTYIKNYKNGVGFKDDLTVVSTDKGKGTNLKVSFYKERLENMKEFIKTSNPEIDIKLNLKKYNNKLSAKKAEYKITAANVKDISKTPFVIKNNIYSIDDQSYLLEDLIESKDDLKDIEIIDNTFIKDNGTYRLELTPKEEYDFFSIDKCDVYYIDENKQKVSLLKENENFKFNANKQLVNNKTKKCIKKIKNFIESDNLIDTKDGLTLDNLSKAGYGKVDLTNIKNEQFFVEYDCKKADLPNSYLTLDGFEIKDNKIVSNNIDNAQHITIEGDYNSIDFDLKGTYNIKGTIGNDHYNKMGNDSFSFKSKMFDKPVHMKIVITCTGNYLEVSNIKYSDFVLSKIIDGIEQEDMIPNKENKELAISIKTNFGFCPIIKKIYIGQSVKDEKYCTDVIKNVENKKRKICVRGDLNAKLIDEQGQVVDYFEPKVAYKALSDNAYIKLDLRNFSEIKEIKNKDCVVEKKNNKYFVFLKKEKAINELDIFGTYCKTISSLNSNQIFKIDTSKDDRLYVSSILEGFIKESNGIQTLVHLNKESLGVSKDSKIEVLNLPDDLITKFIISKTNKEYVISNMLEKDFDELIVVPKNSQEYIAYNEYNLYSSSVKNIEIINNFSPLLPPDNKNLAYLVEPVSDNIEVLFESKQRQLWTVGRKTLEIQSLRNIKNSKEYECDLIDISKKTKLNDCIVLSPKYEVNGEIVNLTEYMLSTNDGYEIIYKKRNKAIPLSNSIISEPEFYYVEKVICENDKFNKLKHSNIDDIIYIGTEEWKDENSLSNIKESQYEILKDEGIVIWKDDLLIGNTVYILYSINVPDYIKIDINTLYKTVSYNINAYKLLGTKDYFDLKDNDIVDISKNYLYQNCTRILLECDNPGFNASINDGIVKIKFLAKDNELAVKTGYYYDNGEEYYLFNNQDKFLNEVKNNDFIDYHNIRKENGEIVFTKGSKNYVSNSLMTKDNMFETYYNNLSRNKMIKGISQLNALTACDNFNLWNTVGCDLELVDGINDLGILFNQKMDDGYAYLDITEHLAEGTNYISLYCDGNMNVYIGKEIKHNDLNFNKTTAIEVYKKILNPYNDKYKETAFKKESGYKYYIVISGSGVIDDIILSDRLISDSDIHTKNIDKLGLKINEKNSGNYVRKILFNNNKGAKCSGAELDKDKKIVNSSHIEWGLTNIKNISCKEDFEKCEMERLDIYKNLVISREKGKIFTDPIVINDISTIKEIIIKINNIAFNSMKGFSIVVYGGSSMYGKYYPILKSSNNIFSIPNSKVTPFIRIMINMPKGKIIESINTFASYKESSGKSPKTHYYGNGEYITKILDTQGSLNYKISNINIASLSNINDVDIFIRGAREKNNDNNQWMPWKRIELNQNMNIVNEIKFDNCRFFQAKVKLKTRFAYIKIRNIDLEVI